MRPVTFGSAQLLVDGMPPAQARALLEAALAAGVQRLDTAPLYGHGGSEALVAELAARHANLAVTTKVGLEPVPAPPAWRRLAGNALRRLPAGVVDGLRAWRHGVPATQADGPSGRFEPAAVRASVERSLSRLQRIDRLLLHEVHPADITEELLGLLAGYQRRGDIGALGVATGNAVTLAALRRGHGLFTVAHVCVDPLAEPDPATAIAALPALHWVGHGALGPGGRTLAGLQTRLRVDRSYAARWQAAVIGTPYEGPLGAADALLARAALSGPAELLVATRRVDRVARTVEAAAGKRRLPLPVRELIESALLPAVPLKATPAR